ncbi:Abi family protein [uncultured Bacteroides sp.]|uniref:Abi family protein n=1 Tax=uncultured Bacteroides sp. TaxID=162156 RepID=UPI002AA73B98|nr:Abi family protein [uncultured Bacteroides sp.]
MKESFCKKYSTTQQQINLLKARGLIINDEKKVADYICNIGYFRLSAYFYPFLKSPKENHVYKANSTFKQVMDIYRFDRKLRLLLFNEIEKIEVAIRSCIVNTACDLLEDIFWITNPAFFYNRKKFDFAISSIDSEIHKSKEDFITHFKETYTDSYPPAWMIVEILPLGTLCYMYMNLKDTSLKKRIAQHFGLQIPTFNSWITILAGLRNMCCHHTRTWNRELPVIPSEPKQITHPWINSDGIDKKRMYYRICMIYYFLFTVSSNNTFKQKLKELLNHYPNVDIRAMGFPTNWEKEPLWM